MAFVANGGDDEEEQKQAGQTGPVSPVGGGGVHLAPSSGVGGTAAPGAAATPAQGAGGSFATLDKYITANQGQAEPLAGKITGAIGDQYSGLDQANQSTLQGITGQVTNAPGYTKGDSDLLAKEAASPVDFTGDQNNISAFQKQLTNSYGGPQSAEGTNEYQAQQAKLNDAIAQGQAQTQTASGRKQLIAQNSATPTTGVTALNSAILSKDPNYLGQVENAYKPFSNLVSGLSTGAQGVDKTIAGEQADAASSSKAAQDQITGQISGLNTAVQNQLSTAQQNATAQNAAVKNALTTGTADPGVLSALGMSQDQWNTLTAAQKAAATSQVYNSADNKFSANSGTVNVDLNQFNQQLDPNAAFNTANVATADQYKQAGAFQNLLNGLNLNTPQAIINQSTAAQAGTAPTNTNTYDYNSALGTTQGAQAQEQAAAQAYVAALQSGADEEHAQAQAQKAASEVDLSTKIGAGVGTVAGGIIGSLYPGVGTLGGATVGAGVGAVAGDSGGRLVQGYQNTAQHPTSTKSVADIATGGLASPVAATIGTIKHIFCFHPWTLVEMADGSLMPIYKIMIGDNTRGGKVLATTRGVGTQFYWYDGVLVTGKHAVKEGGRWLRIEDSARAKVFHYLTEVVCNLVTEKHRIWANSIEFADEHENDNYENLNLQQSLDALNQNG